jgi:hypothetical protein
MTDDSSDLSGGIVPDDPRHIELKRRFAPWHKVRKEFVRKEQWNKFILRYIDRFLKHNLQAADGENEWGGSSSGADIPNDVQISGPLNCLVIPGDDLLDIRSLHRDTESVNCYIRYLGFNAGQDSNNERTRVHVAHNDVTSSKRVSQNSRVLGDSFQRVASKKSQAWQYIKEFGPFHIVNLDLCDSLFPNTAGDLKSYFDALHSLVDFQMRQMSSPWMMFITTEVAPNEVDLGQLDKLCEPTKQNVQNSKDFAEALTRLIPADAFGSESSSEIDISELTSRQVIDLFGVALGKALLGFGSTAEPKWKVRMLGSHIYDINPDKEVSMLSLAFHFDPVTAPPQDGTGISSVELRDATVFDEFKLATKLVSSVEKITDIDKLLLQDPELYAQMRDSSADLLALAGYDRNAYLQWVNEGEQTINP